MLRSGAARVDSPRGYVSSIDSSRSGKRCRGADGVGSIWNPECLPGYARGTMEQLPDALVVGRTGIAHRIDDISQWVSLRWHGRFHYVRLDVSGCAGTALCSVAPFPGASEWPDEISAPQAVEVAPVPVRIALVSDGRAFAGLFDPPGCRAYPDTLSALDLSGPIRASKAATSGLDQTTQHWTHESPLGPGSSKLSKWVLFGARLRAGPVGTMGGLRRPRRLLPKGQEPA